ncbi:MAG: cell division protein ZapA [Proteobacteria bacterium]|nr:cell division protein ZapA [Pseudomonadota bacterium]
MKQVEVSIMGHGYILGCPEGGEALLAQAVASVDKEMTHIRDSGKVKARERIAVLAALNLAYQLAESLARQPAAPAVAAVNGAGRAELDLAGLLRRVDAALGDDGQLL